MSLGPFKHPCTIVYRFTCAICNKVDDTQRCHIPANGHALMMNAPPEWVALFGDTLICPEHKIETIFVDGLALDSIYAKYRDHPDGHYWVKWEENSEWSVAEKYMWRWIGGYYGGGMVPHMVGVPIVKPEEQT